MSRNYASKTGICFQYNGSHTAATQALWPTLQWTLQLELFIFTAQCYAECGYATVYCLCPSITFRYRDHIGWNSSKIISRPNSLRLMRGLTPTWAIWCNRNTQKLGWNRGEVTQEHKKTVISPKRCKIEPRLLWRTNRKSHRRFRLVPKRPWMAKTHSCGKKLFYRAHQKHLNEDRHKLSSANVGQWF